MRKILIALAVFIASLLCFEVAKAQTGTVQLGSYLTTVYNSIPGGLQVAKNVKLSQYAAGLASGDTVVLYLTSDGVLRVIPLSYVKGSGGGGGGSADSSIFETRHRTDTAKIAIRQEIAAMSGGGADSGIFQTNYRADTAKQAIYIYLWNLSDTAQALLDSVFVLRGGIETNAAGIAYNLTRINAISDSTAANRDSINIHRTAIDGKEPPITPGTTDQYWQGDKTWQPKSGLPISTATQAALDGKISYADTPYIATQNYLEQNYFKNGGNVFGDEFKVGNLTWSQFIYGDGNGDYIFNNGAGPGWMFHWVQNNLDTVLTINRQNEMLVGSVGNAPVDAGHYKFQVQGSGYIRDSLTIGKMPKLSSPPDTTVGVVNGLLVSYPTPDGADTIGLQGVLENGNVANLPIKLVDYVNPNAQLEARAKLSDLVLKREQDFEDTASGLSLLVNPKFNIGAVSPSYQVNGAEISPMYKLDGSTNVRGWSLQVNRYWDSASSGHILNHTILSTGGSFGPDERLERYCGVEIHNPPVYDTADYIYGLRINSFEAPNYLNSAAIAIGSISDVYTGNWNIYCSQYVTKPNQLGNVPTYIGLPDDTPIDDTSKLQFTTGIAGGLLRYNTDLSATYDDRTMVDKGYVDAEIASIPVLDTTSLDARINAKQPYTQSTVIDEQTNTTYSSGSVNLKRTGSGSTITSTAGNTRIYHAVGTFAPTSGTAAFASVAASPTVNQTGGANGITSGFLANPNIIAAADYRGFDAANASGVAFYNRFATARNIFLGETHIGSATDFGDYLLQVTGAAIFDDSIRANGLPRGTQDSCVYIGTNGTLYKGLCPAGGSADSSTFFTNYRADTMRTNIYGAISAGGLQWSDTNVVATKYDIDTVNAKIPDVSGFISWSDTGSGIGTKHDIDTLATSIYGAGYLPAATAASTYVPLTRTINGNALSANVMLDAGDIDPVTNRNYVTDAQSVVIGNTSGTNTGDQTITLTGDVTGTGTGSFATTIAAGAVDVAMLSATGTPSATNYLRGDGTWSTPAADGVAINTQTGTTYTVLSSDNGKIIEFTNSSAVTVTLPSGLGTTFTCIIRQNGTGDVTLATSGTTVNNANTHTSTRAQYSAFAILPTSTANTFITQGDMD